MIQEIIFAIYSLIIGFVIILFLSERKKSTALRDAFIQYVRANNRQLVEQPVQQKQLQNFDSDDQEDILVGRWECINCKRIYTLNFYQLIYNQTHDGLDITDSYRIYNCLHCGNNLMKFYLQPIKYGEI